MWLKAQLDEFRVFGVVIMLLRLYSRVWNGLGFHVDPELISGFCDEGRELVHRELLGELVEDPELAGLGWIGNCDLNALNRVTYVEISPCLNTS